MMTLTTFFSSRRLPQLIVMNDPLYYAPKGRSVCTQASYMFHNNSQVSRSCVSRMLTSLWFCLDFLDLRVRPLCGQCASLKQATFHEQCDILYTAYCLHSIHRLTAGALRSQELHGIWFG